MNDMHDSLGDEQLNRLLHEASTLPREVEPPAGAWNAIRTRIEAQRVVAIAPAAGAPLRRTNARWWKLAAAAGIVIAVSLAVQSGRRGKAATLAAIDSAPAPRVLMFPEEPPRDSIPVQLGRPRPPAVPAFLASTNPALATALDQYQQASRELEEAVQARTAALPPATREVVRRSLATIDGAIADLRGALGSDPRNAALGTYLSAAYEQKLDFLKRVRALPAAGM